MNLLVDDLRYSCRSISRARSIALVIVVTIALGVGINAALFSALNALVLRPLAVQNASRLLGVSRVTPLGQARPTPLATVAEFNRHQTIFDELCGYAGGALLTVETNGNFTPAVFEFIAGPYYSVLGAQPALGRLLSSEDAPLAGEPAAVAVLGHGFWRRHFSPNDVVVGRTIRVEGLPLTVIGVTAQHFSGLQVDIAPDVTIPVALFDRLAGRSPNPGRPRQVSSIVGRLRRGVSVIDARSQLAELWPRIQAATVPAALTASERDEFRSMRVSAEPLQHGFSLLRKSYAQPLRLLLALTAVLLALACVNLAGLLRARLAMRQHDLLIRMALGASRQRLVSQVIVEMLLLSLGGAALALPIAWWGSRALGAALWDGFVPMTLELTPDPRVLGVMILAALVVSFGIGVMPTWAATRPELHAGIAFSRTISSAAPRWGRPLIVLQFALSFVLVFAACVFAKSLVQIATVDPGFRAEHVVTAKLVPQPNGYRDINSASYYRELVRRLSALPEVRSVAFSRLFTGAVDETAANYSVALSETPSSTMDVPAAMDMISPRFFETLGIPWLAGRDFAWDDEEGKPAVVIVNRSLARRLVASGDVIDRHIRIGVDPKLQHVRIVGVVGDASMGNLRTLHMPVVFRPALQEPQFRRPLIEVRTSRESTMLGDSMRRTIASLGREYVFHLQTLETHLRETLMRERIVATLATVFAGLAVLLASLGTYGLLSFGVARRTSEVGVRMALGASRTAVLWMITREGALLMLAGLVAGIPCALLIGRLADSLLFGVTPSDGSAFAIAAAVLSIVGLGASLVPATRASSVEPSSALRVD